MKLGSGTPAEFIKPVQIHYLGGCKMSVQKALLDFLNDLGIKKEEVVFKRKGKIAYINCPFHYEKTPSMRIVPGLSYYCFGCGADGNCRDDLQEMLEMRRRYLLSSSLETVHTDADDIPF